MDFQELIKARRSIRRYDPDRRITRAELEDIIAEAQLAPSWKNVQASRYHCLLAGEEMDRFRESCLPGFNAKNCQGAAALVVSTVKKGLSGYARPDGKDLANEVGEGWGLYDLGLHDAFLILSAQNRGLASLIMGLRYGDRIRAFLDISPDEDIVSVIALGYAAEVVRARPRHAVSEIAQIRGED